MTKPQLVIRFSVIDLFLVLVAGVALVFWQEANNLIKPFDAYPKLVCASLFALAFACLIQQRLKVPDSKVRKSEPKIQIRTWSMIVGIAVYIVCISTIGYFVSTFVYLVAMLQIGRFGIDKEFLETKTLLWDSLVSGAVSVVIATVFKLSLNLVFPSAWLF
ncbi:MAG: tripartite tricarboxylate transporter TctB family protein [Opitutaceae bacterium]|nr:tripartite tricarboxylate transporter TctB family protein [Opitutaceae bacterium]